MNGLIRGQACWRGFWNLTRGFRVVINSTAFDKECLIREA
jgi:hypothetical protein